MTGNKGKRIMSDWHPTENIHQIWTYCLKRWNRADCSLSSDCFSHSYYTFSPVSVFFSVLSHLSWPTHPAPWGQVQAPLWLPAGWAWETPSHLDASLHPPVAWQSSFWRGAFLHKCPPTPLLHPRDPLPSSPSSTFSQAHLLTRLLTPLLPPLYPQIPASIQVTIS